MRTRFLFLAFLYFPGTVIHELSHYLVARLLFVPTGNISLIPRFQPDGLELGHVQIAKTDFIRRFLIGVAPLVVGIIILFAVVYVIMSFTVSWWGYVALGYLSITVLNTMSLSKSDLHGAWKIALILALALLILITLH